jgi:hypothetical protein
MGIGFIFKIALNDTFFLLLNVGKNKPLTLAKKATEFHYRFFLDGAVFPVSGLFKKNSKNSNFNFSLDQDGKNGLIRIKFYTHKPLLCFVINNIHAFLCLYMTGGSIILLIRKFAGQTFLTN